MLFFSKSKWYVLAGAILITGSISFYWLPEIKQYYQDYQDKKLYHIYRSSLESRMEVTLPDHTQVILANNSTLKVPLKMGAGSLPWILEGAAYFTMGGNPFVLRAMDLKAEGGRASFFVRAYPYESGQLLELLDGTLNAGKNYHSTTDNHGETLGGGDMVMLNRSVDLIEKEQFVKQDRINWIQGKLSFRQQTFAEVVRILEDWYGLPFEVSGTPKNMHFSGNYSNIPLAQMLDKICATAGGTYHIRNNQVQINF